MKFNILTLFLLLTIIFAGCSTQVNDTTTQEVVDDSNSQVETTPTDSTQDVEDAIVSEVVGSAEDEVEVGDLI